MIIIVCNTIFAKFASVRKSYSLCNNGRGKLRHSSNIHSVNFSLNEVFKLFFKNILTLSVIEGIFCPPPTYCKYAIMTPKPNATERVSRSRYTWLIDWLIKKVGVNFQVFLERVNPVFQTTK